MNTNIENLNTRLTKARVALLLDHPFFGTLATRLRNEFDAGVETCITNGEQIRWNPEFLGSLTEAQLRGVIAHEVLHVANGHTWRRGSRDHKAWNTACDLAINGILKSAGFELPKGELMPEPGQEGKAAEHLYAAPTESEDGQDQGQGEGEGEEQGQGQGPGGGHGDKPGCGEVEDAPDGQAGAEQQEAEWKVAVAQAAEAAKAQGNLPGQLALMAERIVNPVVPWEVLLRDFIERTARNDYNWTRPNRRYIASGIVLPSLISEELPEIVVIIDTSGSIGQNELDQFAAEVSAVLGAYETTIRIIYADTRVAHTQAVTRADLPLKLEPRGGGGTDFRPAFAWVAKEGITPACALYLTDGYGTFPPSEPDYPVLWIMTTDIKAPHGETVKMDLHAR